MSTMSHIFKSKVNLPIEGRKRKGFLKDRKGMENKKQTCFNSSSFSANSSSVNGTAFELILQGKR